MQSRFDRILASLEAGQPCLVAVSGGVDSMVMLDLFRNSSMNPEFVVAHCNFHLRGEESDGDEALVREWAEEYGVAFLKADFDTSEYAVSHGISIEMAARELRYSWFAQMCREYGLKSVAVAHNANDKAETLILNLLRGTGVKGLTGMKTQSCLQTAPELSLVRPLLDFSRDEIYEYALSKDLKWREDSSNADSAYKRNLVRNEIFPLFARLNPSFLKTLGEDAEKFSQVQAIADEYVGDSLKDLLRIEDGTQRMDIQKLKSSRHRKYILFRILNPSGFSSSAVSALDDLLERGETISGKTFLSKEYSLVTTSSEIVVSRLPDGDEASAETGKGASETEVKVNAPGEYSLKGVAFTVSKAEASSFERIEAKGFRLRVPQGTIVADAGKLSFPFVVRGWKAGDWMRPIGLSGRKKLSDLFVDLKMGLPDKEKALVVSGEGSRVLALLGSRLDDSVKVTESTGSVLVISLT